MTKVRFQADADLKQAIVTGTIRREANIDFQSAYAAGLEGKLDPEVLAIAAQDGRVLVTHDRKTMPAEFGEYIVTQTSAGVLILSQKLPIADAIEALILVWEASTAEEWVNQILENSRQSLKEDGGLKSEEFWQLVDDVSPHEPEPH